MSPLTESTVYIFGIVALGYLVAAGGLIKADAGEALADFATSVALPVLLFRTIITADFGSLVPWSLWGTYFTAVATSWALGHLAARVVFGRDLRTGIIAGIIAGFSNLMLLGLPFVQAVFGHDGVSVLTLIVAVHLPSILAASSLLFARAAAKEGAVVHPLRILRDFLRSLLTNPLVVGIALGLAWRLGGAPMPQVALRMVNTFADLAGPLALFAMGMGLRRFGISSDLAPAMLLSSLKLVVMPAIALGMALLLGLPPLAAKVAVVGAAMPTGVNPYLFATRYGTGQAMSSNALTLGTAAAAVTTALWLALAQSIFGP